MRIMLLGLLPFGLTNAYAGTLRECGHPTVPMAAGFVAMIVNLVFNYIFIFGNFGAPAMGVAGAAVATVIARFTELAIVAGWTHLHREHCPYVEGLYRGFHIPGRLFKSIVLRGMPLLVNECLWSTGMAMLNQCYSYCGLDVVPALSIAFTIYNLASVVYHSLGNTVGIITGQMLGAGRPEEDVKDYNRKLTALCTLSGAVFGLLAIALSGVFPMLYNTTESVRLLATRMIIIMSVIMPFPAYTFPVYFTLRAGGKTLSTFLFDCGSVWLLTIPLAYCLSRFTALPILVIFTLCNATDIVKAFIGYLLVRRGDWIQNLTTK
jgi:putative MATE family efflux protein